MDQDLLLPYVPQYLQNSLKVPQSSVYDGDDDDGEDDGSELPSYLREERREEEAGPSMGKRQIGPTLPSYAPTYDPTTHYDDFGLKPLPAGMKYAQNIKFIFRLFC